MDVYSEENDNILDWCTPIIAVDFDGTVVEHDYPRVGQNVPHAVRVLKRLVESRYRIILNTMRSGEELDDAIEWFRENGIQLFSVGKDPGQFKWTTSNKCFAEFYIDDRNVGGPMIDPEGFSSPVVDWLAIEEAIYHA